MNWCWGKRLNCESSQEWNRLPGRLCSLCPWKFLWPDYVKPWAVCWDVIADPALSRRPPWISYSLNMPVDPPSWPVWSVEGGRLPSLSSCFSWQVPVLSVFSLSLVLVLGFRSVGGKNSGQKTPKLPLLGRDQDAGQWKYCCLASFIRPHLLRVSFRFGPEKIQLSLSTRREEGSCSRHWRWSSNISNIFAFLCLGEDAWKLSVPLNI